MGKILDKLKGATYHTPEKAFQKQRQVALKLEHKQVMYEAYQEAREKAEVERARQKGQYEGAHPLGERIVNTLSGLGTILTSPPPRQQRRQVPRKKRRRTRTRTARPRSLWDEVLGL